MCHEGHSAQSQQDQHALITSFLLGSVSVALHLTLVFFPFGLIHSWLYFELYFEDIFMSIQLRWELWEFNSDLSSCFLSFLHVSDFPVIFRRDGFAGSLIELLSYTINDVLDKIEQHNTKAIFRHELWEISGKTVSRPSPGVCTFIDKLTQIFGLMNSKVTIKSPERGSPVVVGNYVFFPSVETEIYLTQQHCGHSGGGEGKIKSGRR